jgi:hypothetical protein
LELANLVVPFPRRCLGRERKFAFTMTCEQSSLRYTIQILTVLFPLVKGRLCKRRERPEVRAGTPWDWTSAWPPSDGPSCGSTRTTVPSGSQGWGAHLRCRRRRRHRGRQGVLAGCRSSAETADASPVLAACPSAGPPVSTPPTPWAAATGSEQDAPGSP